jgi:hypothetical protein
VIQIGVSASLSTTNTVTQAKPFFETINTPTNKGIFRNLTLPFQNISILAIYKHEKYGIQYSKKTYLVIATPLLFKSLKMGA